MISDKGILIKNIYYMLSYAYQVLRQTNYDDVASEDFMHIQDLFAAILAKGIAQQLKQGLYREYITESENLFIMRGKLNIHGTIKNELQRKQMIYCDHDDLTENNTFNQILKTTATLLLRQTEVSMNNRTALKKVMLFFNHVDVLEPSSIKWNTLRYQRNNQSYKMLLNICYFVLKSLLLTTDKGTYKMMNFLDEKEMSSLFEKFVLEYYKEHHKQLQASASQVDWNIDDGLIDFLPKMKTDIMLKNKNKTLIIDTKYYTKSMQVNYLNEKQTYHSNNLYQIFTYVKNEDVGNTGNVSGMLLYAKTEESITPDSDFMMSGNKISVKTLDLNSDFKMIASQLDRIAEGFTS